MLFYHAPGALPPGSGKQHIITFHHINHFFSRMKSHPRHSGDAESNRRKYGMPQPVQKGDACALHADRNTQPDGQHLQPYREYKQQQKSQPENRGAGYEKGIPLNDPIRPGSPENSRQDAKDKPQNT